MSHVHAAPMLEIPPNAREAILPRKDMMRLNMRLSLSSLALTICCTLECIIVSIMFLYGTFEILLYISLFEYATIIIAVCIFYSLIIFLNLYQNLRRMNMYGIPLVHGFTKDISYGASIYHQTVNRWEFYTRWKEVSGYFLLLSQGQWFIIPKSIWTKEELDELRTIMREKIGKPYPRLETI